MGLLDNLLNSEDGRLGLGLLAAGSARSDGAGFGQRLSEAVGSVDQWKQQQAQAKRMKMQEEFQAFQMQQAMAQAKAQEVAQEAAKRQQAGIPGLFRATQTQGQVSIPQLGGVDMFSQGAKVDAPSMRGPTGFDVQGALALGLTPDIIEKYANLNNLGKQEAKDWQDIEGPNGAKIRQAFDKFGQPIGSGVNGYVAPVSVNQGDRTTFVKPAAGVSLPMGMSFADRTAAANLDLSRQKFAFDKAGGAEGSKPPTGYRWKMDRSGLEAIPGGPADIKAGEAGVKAEAKKLAGISSAENVRTTIQEAKDLVGINTAGIGSWASKLPATDARDLSAKLETVKGNLGFDRLQQMRDQSPTGGALGAVAVQELTALQSTVASLDQGQSPSQLRAALGKIDKHYENWQAVMRGENPYDKPKPNQGALGSGSFKIISVE